MKRIAEMLFSWWGWKIGGNYRYDIPKKLLVVVPHTSWVDFFVGILVRRVINDKIKFVGKHSLFFWPLGPILKWLGGVPVNRKKSKNFVEAVAKEFNKHERFAIALAAEGTRKKVDSLKTGYYYMAKLAEVPVIPIKFDYENKIVHFGQPFDFTDDDNSNLRQVEDYFRGIIGKIPEYSF